MVEAYPLIPCLEPVLRGFDALSGKEIYNSELNIEDRLEPIAQPDPDALHFPLIGSTDKSIIVATSSRFVCYGPIAVSLSIIDIPLYRVEPAEILPNPIVYLRAIEGINNPLSKNKEEALQQLGNIRTELQVQFKNGKIREEPYSIWYKAISRCIDEVIKNKIIVDMVSSSL